MVHGLAGNGARAIPLTTFKGQLRQINAESVSEDGVAMLRICAPHFFDLAADDDAGARSDAGPLAQDATPQTGFLRARFRRFSGDDATQGDGGQLSRACYFSVANGADGADGGVLAEELNAYRNLCDDLHVEFFDLMRDDIAAALDVPRGCYVLLAVRAARSLLPFRAGFSAPLAAAVQANAVQDNPFLMTLGTIVANVEFGGVLDLRLPAAQQWFFAQFVRGAMLPTAARRFEEVLPELLAQVLGGSTPDNRRLQAIANYLRALGVQALIYPSARNDVAVSYRAGELHGWHGWNLVLYGATPARDALYLDMGAWETQFPPQVELQRASRPDEGWRVRGLKAWNHGLYAIRRNNGDLLRQPRR
jgi:hypothetical protein